jgi:hypothetical protein
VVDTTVQEKAITQPIDARLTHRAIEKLVAAKREGVELRQSYLRVAKRAASVQDSVIPKLTDANRRASPPRHANQPARALRFFCFRNLNEPENGSLRQPKTNRRTNVPNKRRMPRPKIVISSSVRFLTLRYAELLHLRQAVREAELLASEVSHNPRPNIKQRKTSSVAD